MTAAALIPAPLYHGAGLFRPDEQGLAAVTCHGLPPEVALLHEAVHIDRDKVRFQLSHLHDVAGRLVFGVIDEEQQDIQRRLRQLELLTQGLAGGVVAHHKLL